MSIYKPQYDAPPVVSICIKPKNPHDIDKLLYEISKVVIADNILTYRMDKESGAFILMGIDIFHLEILAKRINEQVNIDIEKPQVVYRERISKIGKQFLMKSANKLNKISLHIEPLNQKTEELILSGKIDDLQQIEERAAILSEKANWDVKEARNIIDVYQGCLLINNTSGSERFDQVRGSLSNAFRDWVSKCIIANEPVTGIKAIISEIVIHEDPRHTQYSQIAGMTYSALSFSMLDAEPHLFEPIYEFEMKIPEELKESMKSIIKTHRGTILNVVSDNVHAIIEGLLPTIEMININDQIKDATRDSGFFHDEFLKFEKMAIPLEAKTILSIRKRKRMPEMLPSTKTWREFTYKHAEPKMKLIRDKIIATMMEQKVKILILDRKYLLEFLGPSFCDFHSDNLPKVKYSLQSFLNFTGVHIQYEGTVVKFIEIPY